MKERKSTVNIVLIKKVDIKTNTGGFGICGIHFQPRPSN
jgi:hypothetical protein